MYLKDRGKVRKGVRKGGTTIAFVRIYSVGRINATSKSVWLFTSKEQQARAILVTYT